MRKLRVRHERLPGIGDLFEIPTGSGLSIRVATHRSGRRNLLVGSSDADQPEFSVPLTRAEATGLAALLVGAHIELINARED